MSNESNFNPLSGARGGTKDVRGGAGEAPRPLILSIDTASGARSLAVTRGAEPLSLHVCGQNSGTPRPPRGHSRVRRGLVGVREVELFARAVGPGVHGCRAGGDGEALAVTLRRPAVGARRCTRRAAGGRRRGERAGVMPAGRGEVFAQHSSGAATGAIETLRRARPPGGEGARGHAATTWAGGARKVSRVERRGARAEASR